MSKSTNRRYFEEMLRKAQLVYEGLEEAYNFARQKSQYSEGAIIKALQFLINIEIDNLEYILEEKLYE